MAENQGMILIESRNDSMTGTHIHSVDTQPQKRGTLVLVLVLGSYQVELRDYCWLCPTKSRH